MESRTLTPVAPQRPRASQGLGSRVRQLRVARGLTQEGLAGERFSKEYLSQIERGKARPTAETLSWLAERLGVDTSYLETGHVWSDYRAVDTALSVAEAAVEGQRWDEALEALSALKHSPDAPELELRALLAESWARMSQGEIQPALRLLEQAKAIADSEVFCELERAEVLFRIGVCRYKLSSISTAQALLTEALTLTETSDLPSDRLRSDILQWRSRCYRRQRDWEAAREDIERALELAEGVGDRLKLAHASFQASLVAERNGHWLRARTLAEQAKTIYEEHEDRHNVGRLLNNLGAINQLLGHSEDAVGYFKDAFSIALDLGADADAGRAVSSLAQVQLVTGELEPAEKNARHAIELLGGRVDYLDEIGNVQLVLGRVLLAQDRLDEAEEVLAEAEQSMSQLSSASHVAAVWTAQGDLAARRDDDSSAARLYRRAAEALQDFRF